jgi:hypothetical protein
MQVLHNAEVAIFLLVAPQEGPRRVRRKTEGRISGEGPTARPTEGYKPSTVQTLVVINRIIMATRRPSGEGMA